MQRAKPNKDHLSSGPLACRSGTVTTGVTSLLDRLLREPVSLLETFCSIRRLSLEHSLGSVCWRLTFYRAESCRPGRQKLGEKPVPSKNPTPRKTMYHPWSKAIKPSCSGS